MSKLWGKIYKIEHEAEKLEQTDPSYAAYLEIARLYQEANRLRVIACR